MSDQVNMAHHRDAVAMVTAPGAFLELTTIDHGGQTLKAYKHAPVSMRDLWMMGQYGDQNTLSTATNVGPLQKRGRLPIATWVQTQGIGPGDRVAIACAITLSGSCLLGCDRSRWGCGGHERLVVADEMAYAPS